MVAKSWYIKKSQGQISDSNHPSRNNKQNIFQRAYWMHHRTEPKVDKVANDLYFINGESSEPEIYNTVFNTVHGCTTMFCLIPLYIEPLGHITCFIIFIIYL